MLGGVADDGTNLFAIAHGTYGLNVTKEAKDESWKRCGQEPSSMSPPGS